MNKRTRKAEDKPMESSNCIAVIAILAEMARCLNKNIAKVHLTPLEAPLSLNTAINGNPAAAIAKN